MGLTPRQREYQGRLQRGVCAQCSAPAMATLIYCSACREKNRQRCAARYRRLADSSLCVDCEKPVSAGQVRCEDCRKDVNARNAAARNRRRLRKMDEQAAEGTW